MVSLQEAAKIITDKSNGEVIPKTGCSYKDFWLISTYPKAGDPNEIYPDGLITVKKSDGSFVAFDPTMDMEGFQQAIKNTTQL